MAENIVPATGNILGKFIPARYILAVLGSVGMAIIYGLKVNLSVALVAMVNRTAIQQMSIIENGTTHQVPIQSEDDGPFIWSDPLQGIILSCYFWGYFVSQIPGAQIAERVSAKWVMFFSVAINILGTLLTPISAEVHYSAVIIMRVLEGIGGGVTFPSMHVMLASWAPPVERSVLSSIVYAGTSLGTVLSMLLAGQLAGNFGWASVFYVMGGLSCLWLILWFWLIQDTPNQQRYISEEERTLIVSSLRNPDDNIVEKERQHKPAVPWSDVIKSKAFWAILIAHACSNWGWYLLLVKLPFFFKDLYALNIQQNAVATSVPFLTMWFFSMALSKTLDTLRTKDKITTTTARKIATLFASAVPLLCLVILCFKISLVWAIILMGIGITSIGGMFCGFLSNHIDIAPNFAGTLMAITNTVATVPGILVPIFVGFITKEDKTLAAWRIVFIVTIFLYVIEILAYSIFGSGEQQAWNKGRVRTKKDTEGTPLNVTDSKTAYTTQNT